MAEIHDLEIVDASNTARFPENMRVNAVNNQARALEGMLARGLKDVIDGSVTTAGTPTAYTVASNRTLSAYYDGMTITVQWNATCGATPTVNVDSIGAKNLYFPGGAQVTTGDLLIGARSMIQYDGTNFQVLTGSSIDTDASLTAHEADTTTHGVSGAIVGISDSQTLTNKTIVAANNTITTAASGNLTSTELNAALAELQTDVDTKTTLAAAQAATAADVVSTNADVVTTNADAATTTQDAIDTAADVVSTNADVILTNADVVSTNADVVTTAAAVVQAQAAAYGWTTVTDITAATTNLEVTDARKYYILDATSNTIDINLPAIGSDEGVLFAFEVKNVDNAITIVRDGTDYINGANGNYSGLTAVGDIIYVTSDDNSPDNWLIVFVSRVPTATTTTEGKVELATAAELTTGTDAGRAITPDAFTNATNIVTPAHVAGAENAQTLTTYTFVLGDAFKQSTFSNASAVAVTLPLNSSVAFADADRLDLVNLGAGTVTFTAASGVTINGTDGGAFSLEQWKGATLLKTGTDAWAAPNQTVA